MEKDFKVKILSLFFSLLIPLAAIDGQDYNSEISDFEARLELAKILSYNKKTQAEAWEHYHILLKENPRNPSLWLEISRLLIAQGRSKEAYEILKPLTKNDPLLFNFSIEKLAKDPKQSNDANVSPTLVNQEDLISDTTARHELAKLYAQNDKTHDEALKHYHLLLEDDLYNPLFLVEASRLYIHRKNYERALLYLYAGLDWYPWNEDLLVGAAHAELGLNHARNSDRLLQRALSVAKNPESIQLDQASVFMMVGDFYKAEAIYRRDWENHPNSLEKALRLAWSLVSAQRYEEAEGLYQSLLLQWPREQKIIQALAVMKLIEKDFDTALCFLNLIPHDDPAVLLLKGEALYRSEKNEEAFNVFNSLTFDPDYCAKAFIWLGRLFMRCGNEEEADKSFQCAYQKSPTSIPAQFYLARCGAHQEDFIASIIQHAQKPAELVLWAEQFAENGMGGMAEFYTRALELDPEYFPAINGLAEALSAHYQYDESIDLYLSILEDFPGNSKMMIAIARVLSWAKRYRNSMQWYDEVIAMNPCDPLPIREKARVANWGKYFLESDDTYASLLHPTVDTLLLDSIKDSKTLLERLNCSIKDFSKTIYGQYESLSAALAGEENPFKDCKPQLEELLIYYLPLYRIQKAISLEKQAKALDWENDFIHALPWYHELVQFSPGNFEALYGYAQDFCNVGLCNCSRQRYVHMLDLDPSNNLVKMSLERNLLLNRPLVQGNYNYWTERGAGQFANSQIARHQFNELIECSPNCNQHIRLIQSEWLEYPFFNQTYYAAQGQTIEVDHLINEYSKALFSIGYKTYFNRFPSQVCGSGTLWFNNDYLFFGLGVERRNEIYNYFTLTQGIQAKVYWATLRGQAHYWNLEATYRHLRYNDRNDQDHVSLLYSYAFTEDPCVFKLILQGNYRNTAHLTEFIINPTGQLIDVIHPYWTPRNYSSGSATLEFRYNYAWFTFCEAPQKYIDIKLTGEADNAHNPSIQLAISWKHEFFRHWGFEITALFHRSSLWNADGVWSQIYYRF